MRADTNIPWEIERAADLVPALKEWLQRIRPQDEARNEYRTAFRAVDAALRATVTYMEQRRGGQPPTPETENQLSTLWGAAAEQVMPLDPQFGNRCFIKGQGWTDPAVWNNPRYKHLPIKIDDMREGLMELNKRHFKESAPSWFPVAGVLFTIATSLSLFYLLVVGAPIDPNKRIIFDVWVALNLAASVGFIGGSAYASGKIPLPSALQGSPVQFAVGGGVAVFIVVFLLMFITHR
jgi:hypothetical protein